jgi:endonuclease/exonuclease/phosphatase family metal-dependent hydrolase
MINEFPAFVVANSHFPLSKQKRVEAAAVVRAALKPYAAQKPVFLMGDLNALPDSETIASLKEDFVVLTDPAAFTFPAKKPDRTIDYIMVDKAHSKSYLKAKTQVIAAPQATDHAAIVIDL